MNRWLLPLCATVSVVALALSIYALCGPERATVAIVQTQVVMKQYSGAHQARSEFQKKSSVWRDNVDTLSANLKSTIEYYKSLPNGSTLKDSVRNDIQQQEERLNSYAEVVERKAQDEQAVLADGLVAQIRTAAGIVAQQRGMSVVLSDGPDSPLLYSEQTVDITQDVLNQLNSSYVKVPIKPDTSR